MSSVTGGQVSDITNKWELAQRIAGHTKAPEDALRSVFTGAMQSLEGVSKTKFEDSMKDRIWNSVSGEKLKTLKDSFILDVCEKILGIFNEDEANAMLEEHRKMGVIKSKMYSTRIQTAFSLNQSAIIDNVVQKADSMTKEWIPEIVRAVRREGIELPEPKIKK